MLYRLRGGEEAGIKRRRALVLLHDFRPFLGNARRPKSKGAQRLAGPFEAGERQSERIESLGSNNRRCFSYWWPSFS